MRSEASWRKFFEREPAASRSKNHRKRKATTTEEGTTLLR